MGRKAKDGGAAVIAERTEKAEKKSVVQEMDDRRAIINAQNTDKANRDMLIKTNEEMQKHLVDVRKEIQNASEELALKTRALHQVNDEIKAQVYTLNRQNELFEKKNSERIELLEKKEAEIQRADAEYKRLIIEINLLKDSLKKDINKLAADRLFFENEIKRLTKHAAEVEAASKNAEADIAGREKTLREERETFEEEKAQIKPQLEHIAHEKGQVELVGTRLENEKKAFDAQITAFNSYKARIADEAQADRAKIEKIELSLKNEEARLREWEQNLKDYDLELQAREATVAKERKRHQLKEVIKEGKTK